MHSISEAKLPATSLTGWQVTFMPPVLMPLLSYKNSLIKADQSFNLLDY